MTRKHDEALLDLIRQIPALSEFVFDGDVQGRPQRYVLVHSTRGLARTDRLAGGAPTRIRKSYWVHSVGASKGQADAVAEKVLQRLVGTRLVVPGWVCEPLTHEASEPTTKDDSRQPVLYAGIDQLDLYSSPTPDPATPTGA